MSFISEKYQLNNRENLAPFNKKAGVYFLIHRDEIIYIGQSQNLKERLNNHKSPDTAFQKILKQIAKEDPKYAKGKIKSLNRCYYIGMNLNEIEFRVISNGRLKDKNKREQLEEYCISLFKPRFNLSGIDIPYRRTSKIQIINGICRII